MMDSDQTEGRPAIHDLRRHFCNLQAMVDELSERCAALCGPIEFAADLRDLRRELSAIRDAVERLRDEPFDPRPTTYFIEGC